MFYNVSRLKKEKKMGVESHRKKEIVQKVNSLETVTIMESTQEVRILYRIVLILNVLMLTSQKTAAERYLIMNWSSNLNPTRYFGSVFTFKKKPKYVFIKWKLKNAFGFCSHKR